ncbi:hypothetical protein T4A_5401 [Trichinella pseudospiralis]|uniref:Uncharacterized protein n=1 Tax=Trichinella pseudospiralis TaxID=6337 RepID=A0A0V1EDV9_TRIPS|nr:hypothetical protein T4A_5401 [Trichinella pseudospiralis]
MAKWKDQINAIANEEKEEKEEEEEEEEEKMKKKKEKKQAKIRHIPGCWFVGTEHFARPIG